MSDLRLSLETKEFECILAVSIIPCPALGFFSWIEESNPFN